MAKNRSQILGLGAALAALSGVGGLVSTPAAADVPATDRAGPVQKAGTPKGEPNVFLAANKDLLGLIVSTAADGTVVADHYSHVSHASHSSHSSHYSSR